MLNNKEDLNKIPGEEEGRVLAETAQAAQSLASKIDESGCGPTMAGDVIKSSAKLKASVDSLRLNKSIMAHIPDIHLSRSEEDTRRSLVSYARGCKMAGTAIKSMQEAAGRKLQALADAVESSKNPSEEKVNAHFSSIMKSLKAGLYDGGAYSQQDAKNMIRNEARETSMTNLQRRPVSSVVDWDVVQAQLDEAGINVDVSQFKGVIGRLPYAVLEIIRSSIKGGTEQKEFKKELESRDEEEPEGTIQEFAEEEDMVDPDDI